MPWKRRSFAPMAGVLLWLLAVAGDRALGKPFTQSKTREHSRELVERAQETVEKLEKAHEQLERMVDRYNDLLGKDDVEDRQKEYEKLRDELEKTEERMAEAREGSRKMEEEAEKLFTEWSKGLNDIDDPDLRALSESTLEETRSRFGRITDAAKNARQRYDSFTTRLRDQLNYLELNMSDASVAKLKHSQVATTNQAKALFESIEALDELIEEYAETLK